MLHHPETSLLSLTVCLLQWCSRGSTLCGTCFPHASAFGSNTSAAPLCCLLPWFPTPVSTPRAQSVRLCRAHLRRVRAQHARRRSEEVPDQHGEARQPQEEEPWQAVLYDSVQDVLQEKAPVRKARKSESKRESGRRFNFEVQEDLTWRFPGPTLSEVQIPRALCANWPPCNHHLPLQGCGVAKVHLVFWEHLYPQIPVQSPHSHHVSSCLNTTILLNKTSDSSIQTFNGLKMKHCSSPKEWVL